MYDNLNGLNSILPGNDKLENARQIIDDMEADVVAYCEHRQNLRHKQNKNGFIQMFNGGETDIRAIAAQNANENVGQVQEGGTEMLAFGNLMDQFYSNRSGRDELGLGRWTFMRFVGSYGVVTYMVCGYNPTENNKVESRTTYQQHRILYINKQKEITCPRKRLVNDLIKHLETWREEGARIVLCAYANENIYDKALGKRLTSTLGLNMKEVVGSFTGQQVGATSFRGSKPIDGIWATSDLVVTNACIMSVGYSVAH